MLTEPHLQGVLHNAQLEDKPRQRWDRVLARIRHRAVRLHARERHAQAHPAALKQAQLEFLGFADDRAVRRQTVRAQVLPVGNDALDAGHHALLVARNQQTHAAR